MLSIVGSAGIGWAGGPIVGCQVEPYGGAARVPQVAPLGGHLLYQVQALPFARQGVALDDWHAG
jgi:hypothetical protein